MGLVGAIVGFILGFIAGQGILMLILADGRHRRLSENATLKPWLGALALMVSFVGAYIGYRMAS